NEPASEKTGKGECIDVPVKKGFLNEIHIMGSLTQPLLKASGGQSEDIKRVKDSYAGLSLSIDLNNFIKLNRNARFGLNILLPATGNLLSINDLNPGSPRYLQNGHSLERPTIMGGAGIELWKDRLYAGVGFTALVKGRGSALLKNVQLSPDQTVPNQQVIVDIKPFVNPTFGLMGQWKNFYTGISYKREIMTSVDPVNARAQTAILAIQLDVKLALFDHFTPRTWNYGIGYRFLQKYLVTADLNRELWSAFKMSSVKNEYSQPVFFRDISNPRVGFEYSFRDNILFRAGYGKRMNPAGRMPGEANIIDFERRIGSIGATYAFFPDPDSIINTPVILDLVYEYHSLKSEVQNKYMHSADSANYTAKGRIHHFGFSLTAYF
ncbi:MAG TPA: TonB-dependent receptor, partial [Leptospiraceae bacterium]|nr:TonB-dependent receptor [Leptospiraceae bacterium]